MKNRITSAVAVYLILELRESRILIVRRCNTGYQDGMWQIPAGHLETGESPTEAMIREAKEEIGITLKEEDLKLVHVSARPKHDETGNRIDFFFQASRWTGKVVNAERHKCDKMRRVRRDQLPGNMTPHVRHGILRAAQGMFFSEFPLEWIKAHPEYGIK